MTTITTPPHVDKETNPWESQRARFDLAAQGRLTPDRT